MHRRTICVLVAGAFRAQRIAISAGARRRTTRTELAELQQAHVVAAIAAHRVVVVAAFHRLDDAIATTSNDTHIGIRREFTDRGSSRTIGILVTNAAVVHRVARRARTLIGRRARFAKLAQTHGAAAVARHHIAVVATFAHFDDLIATPRHHAHVRVGLHIAQLESGTIDVRVARANHHVAETARANRTCHAGLSELLQALRVATVARRRIAVVAPLTRVDHAIATTCSDALVRHQRQVARLVGTAIRIAITDALIDHRIAETARARRRRHTALQQLDEAHRIATIAGRRIAIVATFVHFDDAIAASRSNTAIRTRLHIAHIGHGTIGILIARANIAVRIAESARTGHIEHAGLSEFLQTHRIATVAGHRIAVVATFTYVENIVPTSRRDAHIRVWRRRTYLAHCAIGIRIASADVTRRIAIPARTRRTRTRTHLPEFEETNAIATVAIRAIAVVTPLSRAFLTITTNGTAQRTASNRVRECRVQRTATASPRRSSRAIRADVRSVVRRPAIIVCGIGRVEPRDQRWRQFDRPIHEKIVVDIRVIAECPRRDLDDLGMTHRRRQRSPHRRNRWQIRRIRRTVRRRSHRILVEIDGVWIVDAIDDRRILVRRQIAVRIDETTPPEWTDVRRILTRIDIETQTEIQMRRVGCNVQRRIHCITNDIATPLCVTLDINERLTAITSNNPARVWRGERKRRRSRPNVITPGNTSDQTRGGEKSNCPVARSQL